ncbi:MAG: protein kinase [Verrucomicrobiales bacterium]|nr:protein kinase [Verrucomicrobiales bacterium]
MASNLKNFGDFVVLGELGRGATGVVYQAVQVRLNRPVALKVLRTGCRENDPARSRFLREAEATAALHHAHIVPVYQAGEVDGELFLAMKPFSGGSLAERLAEQTYEARAAATLMVDLAGATHYAHSRGVLHRDIKPGNVLLDENGAAHLGDFGIARLLEAAETPTALTAVIGTPAYLAPEVAREGSPSASAASDIYSLGAVLYELLAGHPPHRGEQPLEILRKAASDPITPPSRARNLGTPGAGSPTTARPAPPADLEQICLKCLEREPRHRYASAADLVEDLGRFLRGEPVVARPVSALEKSLRWARRHPARTALATGAISILILAASALTWQWWRAEDLNARFQAAYLSRQRAQIEELLERNDAASAIAQLYLTLRDRPKDHASARRALSVLAARSFPLPLLAPLRHEAPVRQVAFLPGDRELLTVSGRTVQFWDAATGTPRRRVTAAAPLVEAAISDDGAALLTVTDPGSVSVWSAGDGEMRFAMRLDEPLCAAGWRGTSSEVFLLGKTGALRVLDARDGTSRTTICWPGKWVYAACDPGGRRLAALNEAGEVRFWDFTEMRESAGRISPREPVDRFVFSPSGQTLLTFAGSRGLTVAYESATGRPLARQPVIRHPLDLAVYSPEGLRLAGVMEGTTAAFWEILPAQRVSEWLRHQAPITALAFSHDGARLITGSEDGTAVIWTALDGAMRPLLLPAETAVGGLGFSREGHRVFADGPAGTSRNWQIDSGQPVAEERAPTDSAGRTEEAPGRWRIRLEPPNRLSVRSVTGDRLLAERTTASQPGEADRWVAAGDRLALLTGRRSLELFTLPDLEPLPLPPGFVPASLVADMAFSPNGRWLALGMATGEARLWDLAARPPIERLLPLRKPLRRIAFDPTGEILFLARESGSVASFETATLLQAAEPLRSHSELTDLAVSPDGRWLACGHLDRAVRLWRLPETGDGPVPRTLLQLLQAVGGQQHLRGGAVRYIPPDELHEACRQIRESAGNHPEEVFARWFVADRASRTVAPGTRRTTDADLAVAEANGSDLLPVRAVGLHPNSPALLRRCADVAGQGNRLLPAEITWLRHRADTIESAVQGR